MSRSAPLFAVVTLLLAGLAATPAFAQQRPNRAAPPAKPTALTEPVADLDKIATFTVPAIDREAVRAEDTLREQQGLAPRFAIPYPVAISPRSTDGTWEQLDADTMLWRLRITAPGALSLNLGFTHYRMTPGGQLFIYAADGSDVIRPFTQRDNATHGELWTPVVLSDDIIIELTIPAAQIDQLDLELTWINYGYRGFGELTGDSPDKSGSCNVDVICPEGDDWRLEIASVAVISTGGSTFCTGFMVNNTANDLTPYFMTAYHCGINSGNAASLVVYWNYENSWCRPPGSPQSGGPGDGTLTDFQTGSFWRAAYSTSDFTLVQLDEDPDPAWDVAYAGWDHSGADANSAVGIHHPNTDEKRISFEYQPTSTTSYLGTSSPGDGTHVRITDWDLGTTEPGSSGSPLFNQDHHVIGQLHGGYAACGNNESDWYGKFARSWTGGGSSTSRLSDWLDAADTGAMSVDTISLATLCPDAGEVTLDSTKYGCEGVVGITVWDCGLNTDDQVIEQISITLDSDTEPAGEVATLTETTPSSAKFRGTLQLSSTDSAGVLQVADGDTITATYVDADDGKGGYNVVVTATATVDCLGPAISNVQVIDTQPRSATITFTTDELGIGSIRYGFACDELNWSASGPDGEYVTNQTVNLTGLVDDATYYFVADAEDQAGNLGTEDNGGVCFTFTTPDVPDYFTENFDTQDNNDLDNYSITFTPNGSVDFYKSCGDDIQTLPTDPAGGTPITLADDDYELITLTDGKTVSLYGVSYGSFYVGSNGYITFDSGDTDRTETLSDHFERPRISALFDDLSPPQGGSVRVEQLDDRAAVTWLNVPEYYNIGANTFQVEMFFDGRIRLSYRAISAADGLTGLSEGNGIPANLYQDDFTSLAACAAGGCPGDLDGDGFRNVSDFTLFAAAFGSQLGDANYDAAADLNGDGFVNATDFTAFAAVFGTPCP
jgi:hypothetical protein